MKLCEVSSGTLIQDLDSITLKTRIKRFWGENPFQKGIYLLLSHGGEKPINKQFFNWLMTHGC